MPSFLYIVLPRSQAFWYFFKEVSSTKSLGSLEPFFFKHWLIIHNFSVLVPEHFLKKLYSVAPSTICWRLIRNSLGERVKGKWGGKVKTQQLMGWLLHIWNFWFQRLLNFQKTNKKYCYDVQRRLGERCKSEFLQPHGRRWRVCHNLGAAFQLVVSESGMRHHLETISSLFSVTLITNTLPIFLALHKEMRSGSRLAYYCSLLVLLIQNTFSHLFVITMSVISGHSLAKVTQILF